MELFGEVGLLTYMCLVVYRDRETFEEALYEDDGELSISSLIGFAIVTVGICGLGLLLIKVIPSLMAIFIWFTIGAVVRGLNE